MIYKIELRYYDHNDHYGVVYEFNPNSWITVGATFKEPDEAAKVYEALISTGLYQSNTTTPIFKFV